MLASSRWSYIICSPHIREALGVNLAHVRPKDEGETEHGVSWKEPSHNRRGAQCSLLQEPCCPPSMSLSSLRKERREAQRKRKEEGRKPALTEPDIMQMFYKNFNYLHSGLVISTLLSHFSHRRTEALRSAWLVQDHRSSGENAHSWIQICLHANLDLFVVVAAVVVVIVLRAINQHFLLTANARMLDTKCFLQLNSPVGPLSLLYIIFSYYPSLSYSFHINLIILLVWAHFCLHVHQSWGSENTGSVLALVQELPKR